MYTGAGFNFFVPGVFECRTCSGLCDYQRMSNHVCDVEFDVADEGDEGDGTDVDDSTSSGRDLCMILRNKGTYLRC